MFFSRRLIRAVVLSVCLAALAATDDRLVAADPTFVGVLAIVEEPGVATQLGLSDEVRAQLSEIIDAQMEEAQEVVLKTKDVPPEERARIMMAFAATSEQKGLELLTPEQRNKLEQIRIQRAGMEALAEMKVAAQLKLSDEQQQQIKALLEERAVEMTKGGQQQQNITRTLYERKLSDVLSGPQRIGWDFLTGRAAGDAPPEVAAVDNEPAASEKPTPPPTVPPKPAIAAPAPKPVLSSDGKLRFSFQYAGWEPVLQWFADQAGLSLQMDYPPPGTFNYTDNRAYTVNEALDLINSVLQTKGFLLVRNRQMLMVVNMIDDGIPPIIVENVVPELLDERGKYEIMKCLFPLNKMTPEDAERELKPLVNTQYGFMNVMASSRQVLIQETGGNLRTIRSVIEASDSVASAQNQAIEVYPLKHVLAEEVLAVARTLLNIPADQFRTSDNSLSIAVDPLGTRLFFSGKPELVERFRKIIESTDVDPGFATGTTPPEQPQLEVYSILADPQRVLEVLQTLLAGQPDIRLTTDPVTGNLVALARPSQHKSIQALINQMQRDAVQFEVIQLRRYDPTSMVLLIDKLLGKDTADATKPAKGPKITADAATMRLIVRGTLGEIEQIKSIVSKMDPEVGSDSGLPRDHIRMIPLSSRQATSILEQAELLWPNTERSNRIRIVMPPKTESALPARAVVPPPAVAPGQSTPVEPKKDTGDQKASPKETGTKPAAAPSVPGATRQSTTDKSAFRSVGNRGLRFVSFHGPVGGKPYEPARAESPAAQARERLTVQAETPPAAAATDKKGGEIVVTVTPDGIYIQSDDLDALDEYEDLVRRLINEKGALPAEPTIFYLKYAKADSTAALLQEILGISGGDSGGGGGNLLGGMASSLIGGVGGDLIGGLLGGGSSGSSSALQTTGSVSIVPDNRLNVLVIHANPTDLDLIEQLLQVIDQDSAPQNPQTAGKTYLIPVIYNSADEVAAVVRSAFADQIGGSGAQQQRQPSPQEFLQALAGGGRGGRGGGGQRQAAEEQKMTVSVDQRSNSLIVTGPEHLYLRVVDLVEQLDHAGGNADESISIITLNGSVNPELMKSALTSLLGAKVKTSNAAGGTTAPTPSGGEQPQPAQPNADEIRQRIEFFRALQQRQQGGGGPGGGGPTGSPFGSGGGSPFGGGGGGRGGR